MKVTLSPEGVQKALALGVLANDSANLDYLAKQHQLLTQARLSVEARMRQVSEHIDKQEAILELVG